MRTRITTKMATEKMETQKKEMKAVEITKMTSKI